MQDSLNSASLSSTHVYAREYGSSGYGFIFSPAVTINREI